MEFSYITFDLLDYLSGVESVRFRMLQDPVLKELVLHRQDCDECRVLKWRWEEGESDRLVCDTSREIFDRWVRSHSNPNYEAYSGPPLV